MHFEFLISALPPQGHSEKADKEDDHMKEQAPLPSCQGVNKQSQLMGQSDRGVRDKNNTDDTSERELLPTSQGVLK
jgi:hypothetical protein